MASPSNKESSLFDDGDEAIRFDFKEQGREKSWCTSSGNSSCCSLCRLSNDDAIEDMDGMTVDTGLSDLHSMDTLNDLVLSSGFASVAAAQPLPSTSFTSFPHNGMNSSMFAAPRPSQPTKSCQGCACALNNSMMMPSLFGTCGECHTSSLKPPAKANFMTQFASKNSSFLSREERLSLQSLLFPASIPRKTDLLTAGFLSDGPLYSILSFLDVETLVNLRLTNTKLLSLSSDNSAGWKNHCDMLWSQKVRVCPEARRLLDSSCAPANNQADAASANSDSSIINRRAAMEAYKASVLEARNNNELSENDLCFDLARDASGVMWSFRFKESAGIDWTSWGKLYFFITFFSWLLLTHQFFVIFSRSMVEQQNSPQTRLYAQRFDSSIPPSRPKPHSHYAQLHTSV